MRESPNARGLFHSVTNHARRRLEYTDSLFHALRNSKQRQVKRACEHEECAVIVVKGGWMFESGRVERFVTPPNHAAVLLQGWLCRAVPGLESLGFIHHTYARTYYCAFYQ